MNGFHTPEQLGDGKGQYLLQIILYHSEAEAEAEAEAEYSSSGTCLLNFSIVQMGVGHIVFQTCHFGYLGQYIETEVVVGGEKGGHFLHQGMRLSLLLHVFQVSRILLCFSG